MTKAMRRRKVTLLARSQLRPGMTCEGPCIVLEETSTTVVEPGFYLAVDPEGCLRLRRR